MEDIDKATIKEAVAITEAIADALDTLNNLIMSGECSCSYPTDIAKGKLLGLREARKIFVDAVKGLR